VALPVGRREHANGKGTQWVVDLAAAVLFTPAPPPPPEPEARKGLASIIVPTHNDGPNMGVLLERLLSEPEVAEILVVASACTDETVPTVLEVAARCDGKVRLYVEAERSGKVAAINFALGEIAMPYIVVVSGDVLPEPGAVGLLLKALRSPAVGMAGGHPLPVNDPDSPIGHAAHLLWRLHDRLARRQPKLGEMIALRAEAAVSLPRTSVDEACFQALLEGDGWRSAYVPEAVVRNRGPGSARDFVKQRRQVHAGHLWLRHREGYTVPSLQPRLLATEMWRDLTADRTRMEPRRLAWTAGAVAMEAWARLRARADYLRGRENHVWQMVQSTKAPAIDADGVRPGRSQLVAGPGLAPPAADQRRRQHELPL
jgi:hypothetical protein